MEKLRVSVIIPALNEQSLIADAIRSAHDAGAAQVIVVDGGSTDETTMVAGKQRATVLVTSPGRAIQQNAGAAVAEGDVLLFLHADCRLHPDAIHDLRRRLDAPANAVGGFFRQRIDSSDRIFRVIEAGNLARARLLKWAYGDQGIFVRTHAFRSLGGFPELTLMEDLYFIKRLKRLGPLLAISTPITVSARRWKQRGAIRQTLTNWSLITAAHLGISPNRLARFYAKNR